MAEIERMIIMEIICAAIAIVIWGGIFAITGIAIVTMWKGDER